MRKIIILAILFLAFSTRSVFALEKIEVFDIAKSVDGGAVGGRYQKVIQNKYGIFIGYLYSRDGTFTHNVWRLARSLDGGKTFNVVYENTSGTNVPALETDPNGLIYIAISQWDKDNSVQIIRFDPSTNYTQPYLLSTLPQAAAQKLYMLLDWESKRIYFASNHFNGNGIGFNAIDLNGQILINKTVAVPGINAYPTYPYLYKAQNILYLAWHSNIPNGFSYWSIHFILTKDGGQTWQKPNGTTLSLPIIGDNTGPADMINLSDELVPSTFLSSFFVKDNKAQFIYSAYLCCGNTGNFIPRQHYVRYDLNTSKIDINIYPTWKGETISLFNMEAHCATTSSSSSPIYCLSRPPHNSLGIIVSYDNGQTWHDYAISEFSDQNSSNFNGFRTITDDGYFIGSYMDANTLSAKFYRVKILPQPDSDLLTNISSVDRKVTASFSNVVAHPTDWIGLFPVGAPQNGWTDWKWVVDSSGTITLTAPSAGNYEIRYYTRDYSLSEKWKLLDSKTINIKANMDDYNLLINSGHINIFDFNRLISNFGR